MKLLIPVCLAIVGLLTPCVCEAQKPVAAVDTNVLFYVSVSNDEACLELVPDGMFFLRSALGRYSGGSWIRTNGSVFLSSGSGNQCVMSDNGESLIDDAGARWTMSGRDEARKGDYCRSVTVAVRDLDTGKPVKEFSYDYWIETSSGRAITRRARRIEAHAGDGKVVIDTPQVCDLTVSVEARDYMSGIGSWGMLTIEAGDDSASFEIELRRGTTLRGTVVDVAGGKPVTNASVTAIAAVSVDAVAPDSERAVMTDRNGRFVLRGVDPELGLIASHPEYLEFDGSRIAETARRSGSHEMSVKVGMEKGRLVTGTVVDSGQNPIAGVTVGGIGLRNVLTGGDGRFSVVFPVRTGSNTAVAFTKAGYIARSLAVPLYTGAVVLEREVNIEVRGSVVDPDGSPVGRFEVTLGPGRNPEVWQCIQTSVENSNGSFRLESPFADRNWVVVSAKGFVPWEGWIAAGHDAVAKTVDLSRGFSIQGRIALSGGAEPDGGSVVLVPAEWLPEERDLRLSAGEAFLSQTAAIGIGGAFRIEHVNQGEYILKVAGATMSPSRFTVSMPSKNIDLRTIDVEGLGTICGRACWPGVAGDYWALQNAEGEIRAACDPVGDMIRSFTTDEDGLMAISNVPAGIVAVDIISAGASFTWDDFHAMNLARVCAGKTSEVNFNDSERSAGICLGITVGDGSPADCLSAVGMLAKTGSTNTAAASPVAGAASEGHELSIRLVPGADVAGRLPEPVECRVSEACALVGVEDIPPGKYRLELTDEQGAGVYNVLDATDVDIAQGVQAEESGPVWITLGACSIVGRVALPAEDAVETTVAVIEKDGVMQPQYTVCDGEGQFGLFFLKPGTYTLFAHCGQQGWSQRDGIAVSNNVYDAGELKMADGATVKGALFASFEKRAGQYEITATSGNGVSIPAVTPVSGRNGEKFSIANLWPGEWTISLSGDGEILRSGKVSISGCGTVEVDLIRK